MLLFFYAFNHFSRPCRSVLLTCWVSTVSVLRCITWNAGASGIDGCNSELIITTLKETSDLETCIINGVGFVHSCPSDTALLTFIHKVVFDFTSTITLWLQPLNNDMFFSNSSNIWSSRRCWNSYIVNNKLMLIFYPWSCG